MGISEDSGLQLSCGAVLYNPVHAWLGASSLFNWNHSGGWGTTDEMTTRVSSLRTQGLAWLTWQSLSLAPMFEYYTGNNSHWLIGQGGIRSLG